jgi:pimeloyl-ACP methyl ester carboxylesterase
MQASPIPIQCIIRIKHYVFGATRLAPGLATRYSLGLMVCLMLVSPVWGQMISLDSGPGMAIEAEYRPGDSSKPLILFIHGFLQTRDFSTVRRLADALADSGYSTLSPNLSLGISKRKRSVSCESIQLHSLNASAREIGLWVDWARQQGHRNIVVLGHSAGSVMVSAYLALQPNTPVDKTILISLDYFGPGRPAAFESEVHAIAAQKMLDKGDDGLATFALSFCKQYVTTPSRFLSYFNWNEQQVLSAIKNSTVSNHVIFGGQDKRIRKSWIEDLASKHALVHIIDGANHFFDQTHEFDLLDVVEQILRDD